MIKVRVDPGTLDGMDESVLAELGERAVVVVDRMAEAYAKEVDSLLSRRGDPLPGMPPSEVTGELRRSQERRPARRRGNRIVAEVAYTAEFAGRLELGGADERGRYLPAHPYLRVADVSVEEEITRIAEEGL